MAVSVSGDKVTLVADCEPQPPMFSQGPRFVSTAGLTVMGTLDSKEERVKRGGGREKRNLGLLSSKEVIKRCLPYEKPSA